MAAAASGDAGMEASAIVGDGMPALVIAEGAAIAGVVE